MGILPHNGDRHTNTDTATILITCLIQTVMDLHRGLDGIINKNCHFPLRMRIVMQQFLHLCLQEYISDIVSISVLNNFLEWAQT